MILKHKYLIFYILGLIIYGSNGVIVRSISLGSQQLVFLRSLIGTIFLLIVCIITRKNLISKFKNKLDILFLGLSGLSMAADWLLLFEAYYRINVSLAIIINYTGPIVVMLLSPLFFKNKLTLNSLLIILLGFIGVCLVGSNDLTINSFNTSGLVLAFLSSFAYALMVLFNKKVKNITGLENATLQLLFCLIGVSSYLAFTNGFSFDINPTELLPILWLCIINTGLGSLLYFSSIGKLSVSQVSLYGYLEPLSGLLFSVLFLKENLTILQVVGAGLILFGPILKTTNE